MSYIPEIREGDMCERCKLHQATLVTSESALDLAHGFLRMLCECCHLDEQIKQTERAMERYPGLLTDLQSACTDQPRRDLRQLVRENDALRSEVHRQWLAAHCQICGRHYPGRHAMNYAEPHPQGEHCYWPERAHDGLA